MIRNLLGLVLIASCAPPPPPPPPGPPLPECVNDVDCPNIELFFCNTLTNLCVARCATDAQCNSRPAEFALSQCSEGLGCHCDVLKQICVPRLCSADSECEAGLACRDGACVSPPLSSTVTGCAVTPDFKMLRAGEHARFSVLAWDAEARPVVLPAGATWTLPDGATVFGNEVEVLAPASSSFTVHAAFGSIACDARGVVVPPAASGELSALVIDERTGRPIAGAKVVMSARDGSVLQQVESDAAGSVRLQQTGSEFSVTAFHADFSYLTIANAAATTSQLTLALQRNPLDRYGGFSGTFGNVPPTSNMHFARVGWSMGPELARLDLSDPPRPWVETDIRIGSAFAQFLPVPAGSFIGFGDQTIKPQVWALGLNGTCLAGDGQPDEAAITAGACGTGSAWALAADVPLGDFPLDLYASDQFLVLNRLPDFSSFASWVQRDVPFTLRPTPGAATGLHDISDRSQFKPVTPQFAQVPLAFDFLEKLPRLPKYRGAPVSRAFAVGGAVVPGRGFVPLGLGTAVNEAPSDAFVDRRDDARPVGHLPVRMAPAHHGLEGAPYELVTQVSSPGQGELLGGKALSAIVSRFPGNKLGFGLVDLSTDQFPQVPEGGRFEWENRTFRIAAPPTGVSVLRVSFTDQSATSWDVVVDPASPGFTLPAVPGTLRDRLLSNGERSRWVVLAQRLENVDTFTKYLAATEARLTGYSYEEVLPIRIVLESPPVISAGSKIKLGVEGFVLGTGPTDDGVVALSFTGGTNCPPAVLSTIYDSGYTLPLRCVGNAVNIRAELMKPDGTTPLAPPVAWTITVAIH